MNEIGKLLQIAFPAILAIYKHYREANPNDPTLTDEQIIELLRMDSQEIADKAKTWLAAHPGA